jgi:hypothetical protein
VSRLKTISPPNIIAKKNVEITNKIKISLIFKLSKEKQEFNLM